MADALSDWLNTIELLAKGKILGVKFARIFSDAGKDENKLCDQLSEKREDSQFLVHIALRMGNLIAFFSF